MRKHLELTAVDALTIGGLEDLIDELSREVAWLERLDALDAGEKAALSLFIEDLWVCAARTRRSGSGRDGGDRSELAGMIRMLVSDIDLVYARMLA